MNIVAYTFQFWIEVVLAAVIIFAIKHYLDRWRFFVLGSKIPGPKYLPIIGNTLVIFQRNLDLLGKFCEYNAKYGFCKLWMGSWLHIMICSAEDAEIFCTSTALLDRTDHFKFFKIVLGDSIFTANGPKWRKAKRLMEPSFKYSTIKSYIPIVQKKSDILIERLKKEVGKSAFSFLHYMTNCSFDIIVESTFGVSLNAQDGNVELLKHVEEFMDLLWKRTFTAWQQIEILYRLSPTGKNFFRLIKLTNDFADEKISTFKKSYFQEKENLKGQNNIHNFEGKPLIQNLDSNEWTDDEIRHHVLTIISLGFETSSTTTCFIIMMLGMYKDVQEKAYQEISKLDKDFSDVDVMKLEYLDRIVKETIRLFPAAPLTFREASEDIQFGKYIVPKGSAVGINIFAIHRDPKQYENPDAFNPDNFLPENISKRHPYSYIPFLIGRRKCIAEKFAIISMKILVAKMLMNFKIECDLKLKDLELCDHITLKTKNSCYPIRLLSR